MDELIRIAALSIEDDHHRLGWGLTPRLYGVRADGTVAVLDEGDPYEMLERVEVLPEEALVGIGLVCEGWAAPLGEGRPSCHPCRVRVRSAVVVGSDGSRWSVLRRRGGRAEVLTGGEGALMERLAGVWSRAARPPAA